jgi:hypothetical protein
MIAFYLMRINAGKMTIEEVPPKWNEEVRGKLTKA